MVLDKHLGFLATRDLIDVAGEYIDVVKLTFGTSDLYDASYLKKKIALLKEAGIDVMPGGTLTEIAIYQEVYPAYLKRAKEIGFTHMEISDGTIRMTREERRRFIALAVDEGFRVSTEVGTKDLKNPKGAEDMNAELRADLADGAGGYLASKRFEYTLSEKPRAGYVVVEAKEAGRGSTIYDEYGLVREAEVEKLLAGVDDPGRIVWEAPLRDQQDYLIARFGANVNIGNCPPEGVLSLETLRRGLGETPFRVAYERKAGKDDV